MNIQETCVLIKPDAMEEGNAGKILTYFEESGFTIIGCKMIQLNDDLLQQHYKNVAGEDFFSELKTFMKSRPVLVLVLKGENAIISVRELCGKNHTDKGTIRGTFASCPQKNAIHSSDSPENATKEIVRFFTPEELFSDI